MKLEIRIALRYLLWRGSFNFISIITYISLLGIIIGVAALIIVMAIFNGFGEFSEQQLIALDPHIRITAKKGTWIEKSDSLLLIIRGLKEIENASPIISGRVIAMNKTNMNALIINGVEQSEIQLTSGIPNSIIYGQFNIGYHLGYPGLVIGSGLQKRLDVNVNDTIEIQSPSMLEASIKSFKRGSGKVFVVTGVFQTNSKDYDETLALASYPYVNDMLNAPPNFITSIDIRLKNIDNVEIVRTQLLSIIPSSCDILSWFDLHKDLFRIMQYERLAAFVILSLVIIIALFNLLASLSMIVVTKQPDIALMKSLGFGNRKIKSIFNTLGLIIGTIGTFCGVFIAFMSFIIYQNPEIVKQNILTSDPYLNLIYAFLMRIISIVLDFFALDTQKYLLSRIPMSIYLSDILAVAFITILISFLTTIYPSRRAARINIPKAIRNE